MSEASRSDLARPENDAGAMVRPEIVLAHPSLIADDVVTGDIEGMYRVLERSGYAVSMACDRVDAPIEAGCRVHALSDLQTRQPALLVYHHSTHWPLGDALVERFDGPIVVKYHGITPGECFEPYSAARAHRCSDGRSQTRSMASNQRIVRWLADSRSSAEEVAASGVSPSKVGVLPAFNGVDRAFRGRHAARYAPRGPFTALFVGSLTPDNGHVHLLRTLAAWRDLFPESDLRATVIGARQAELGRYVHELDQLEEALGLHGSVEWIELASAADVDAAFRESHVYLDLSSNAAFRARLLEAQALGLPVVSVAAGGADVAGPGQLPVPLPSRPEDYDHIAGLVHQVCTDAPLRSALVSAGCRNTFQRFTDLVVAERFLAEMEPALRSIEP